MRRSRSIKIGVGVAAAAPVVAAFLSLFTSATASADTHIYDGGNTDCTGQKMVDHKKANGDYDYGANNIPITYGSCAGNFAPFQGDMPMNVAVDQGVNATVQAWKDNCQGRPAEKCVLDGFSFGAIVVSISGDQVGADKPGSNTHVITEGHGYGESGIVGDGSWDGPAILAAGAPFGIVQNVPAVPGSENRFKINDFFANGGPQNLGDQIAMGSTALGTTNPDGSPGLPPQHAIPTGTPDTTYVSDDGVTQEVFNTADAFPGVVNPVDVPDPSLPGPDAP